MPIKDLPIFCAFDKQRFDQFGSMDCANFYAVQNEVSKRQQALYPALGRKHVRFLNRNRLIFDKQPRAVFKSIDYVYVFVDVDVYRVDSRYNLRRLTNTSNFISNNDNIWFDFLPVGDEVKCLFADGTDLWLINEKGGNSTLTNVSAAVRSGANSATLPNNPTFVASFGNRFVVSTKDSPQFALTTINLSGATENVFAINDAPLFARASGIVRQFAVLNNQLYIFTDYTTDIWANIPTRITVAGETAEFPWKLNTSYNWDYGIADPFSLDVNFGRVTWLSKNRNGLVSIMTSTGQRPENISSQAVDVLLTANAQDETTADFLVSNSNGFLYEYENTLLYRFSNEALFDFGSETLADSASALEYNFNTKTWSRVIEYDGTRNKAERHVFYNNKHLVTVDGEGTIYELSGLTYTNEVRNPLQDDNQADDAYIAYPMRYELVTPQIYEKDYSEFITDYIEIDFVFGSQTFYKYQGAFKNTVYLITEDSDPDNPTYIEAEDSTVDNPIFIEVDGTDTPAIDEINYRNLFKPHIELFLSDDGGITFESCDKREFSPLGNYRWRMRWYELGASRNRVYKLVCVAPCPIVILGGAQNLRRSSGGAN